MRQKESFEEETLKALKTVNSKHGFTLRRVGISSSLLKTAEDVERLLAGKDWKNAQGWIARQSRVVIRAFDPDEKADSDDEADYSNWGAVLEAELGTPRASLQVRRVGRDWAITRLDDLTETESAEGELVLSEDVVLVTTVQARAARYRRHWTLPEDGAIEVTSCRLVGFEEIKK